jgi:uncharacterized membrane protein
MPSANDWFYGAARPKTLIFLALSGLATGASFLT